jgi:hypothetical protein
VSVLAQNVMGRSLAVHRWFTVLQKFSKRHHDKRGQKPMVWVENLVGEAPFIGIFSLHLMVDVDRSSTSVSFPDSTHSIGDYPKREEFPWLTP